MLTEYSFRGKKYQFNTEASLKMGKEAFVKAHKGVPNIEMIWNSMQPTEAEKPKAPKK